MLKKIVSFFENQISTPIDSTTTPEKSLQLACTALLFEMMRMDNNITENEKAVLKNAIEKKFDLTPEDIEALIELAEEEATNATDYFQFTSLIHKNFSSEEKANLIEHLWEVAYADKVINAHEEHLVRKISELLYVPHSVFIATKNKVLNRDG